MGDKMLHFETITWLWGLAFIPLVWGAYTLFFREAAGKASLEAFIDKALLPHLLMHPKKRRSSLGRSLGVWALLWALLMGALANPRWDSTEVTAFVPDQSVCLLLDVSQSMDVQDVKPSRLARARQKIEDILALGEGMKVGLIAYAADSHMISPLTDDKETIRHLLPSLGTDLAYIQGSRLAPALTMAGRLLEVAPGHNKSIVILTDGGFEEGEALGKAKELARKGIQIHTIGVGTDAGGPIPDGHGNFIKSKGETLLSKLEKTRLEALSQAGQGHFFMASPLDEDVKALISSIKARSKSDEKTEQQTRQWHDRFYIFVFPMLLLLLCWFRRGYVFPALIIGMILGSSTVQAADLMSFFKNQEQLGQEALEQGKFEEAREKFTDPYQQGVASYRAGDYTQAETLFRDSKRPGSELEAMYNLGNTLALLNKFEDAIKAYETVLERAPSHAKAKHNLEVVKKLLEKQKENKEKKKDQKNQDQQQNAEDKDQSNKGKEGKEKSKTEKCQEKSDSSQNQQNDSKSGEKGKSGSETEKNQGSSSSPQGKEEEQQQGGNQEESEKKGQPKGAKEEKKSHDSEKSEGDEGSEDKQTGSEKKPSDFKESGEQGAQKPGKDSQNQEKEEKPSEASEQNKGEKASQEERAQEREGTPDASDASRPKPSSSQGAPFSRTKLVKTQQDLDADQWLNQLSNDPKSFLKNQFYLESQTQGTQGDLDPW